MRIIYLLALFSDLGDVTFLKQVKYIVHVLLPCRLTYDIDKHLLTGMIKYVSIVPLFDDKQYYNHVLHLALLNVVPISLRNLAHAINRQFLRFQNETF